MTAKAFFGPFMQAFPWEWQNNPIFGGVILQFVAAIFGTVLLSILTIKEGSIDFLNYDSIGIMWAYLNYLQMCNSIYNNMHDDEEDQLLTPVLMLDHCIVKKNNGMHAPLAKVNWLCEDTPTWI